MWSGCFNLSMEVRPMGVLAGTLDQRVSFSGFTCAAAKILTKKSLFPGNNGSSNTTIHILRAKAPVENSIGSRSGARKSKSSGEYMAKGNRFGEQIKGKGKFNQF